MKILLLNSVCGSGSTGRICTDLYRVIEAEGHQCCIAFGRGKAPDGYRTIKIGNRFSIYLHALLSRFSDRQGFYSKYATKKLLEKIKNFSPDVIHIHNIHGYYINIEYLFRFLSQSGVKVIWTLHDCWAFTGHCTYFTYAECTKWVRGCSHCVQYKEYPKSLWRDRSKENYEMKKLLFTSLKKEQMTIVTPSFWLKELVKQSFFSVYGVNVIHNGIDLEKFHPISGTFRDTCHLRGKRLILGVANIWDSRKGLVYLERLSLELDNHYKIIVVGKVPKKIIKNYPDILWIPHTESVEQLAEIYSSCDIFVNPTLEDNFPTTNIEALACGIPVITYDTGGSPESLASFCGRVVSYKDYKGLKNAVEEIWQLGISQDRCIKQAEAFEKKKKYMEYLKLYLNQTTTKDSDKRK